MTGCFSALWEKFYDKVLEAYGTNNDEIITASLGTNISGKRDLIQGLAKLRPENFFFFPRLPATVSGLNFQSSHQQMQKMATNVW